MNQYEAMFLFDPTFGATWENCEGEVRRLMERAGAEIIICRQWAERRLAYKIQGRKRGVYVLVYLKAPPDKIGPLERDAELSENILRVLILRADDLTPEAMERAFQHATAEKAGEEARHGEGGGDGGYGGYGRREGRYEGRPHDRRPRRDAAPQTEPVME